MNVIASRAMVTTRPWARSTPAMPPAWSMRDSTQPPKMSPLALVSAGIALIRTVSVPRGVSVMFTFSNPVILGAAHRERTMADIKILNPDSLGKPLGQYSQITTVKDSELQFIQDMV